jgi:hypothetical protein
MAPMQVDNCRASPAAGPAPSASGWGQVAKGFGFGLGKSKRLGMQSSSTGNLAAMHDEPAGVGGGGGGGARTSSAAQAFGSVLAGTKSGRLGLRTSHQGGGLSGAQRLPGLGSGDASSQGLPRAESGVFEPSALDGGRFGTALAGGPASLVVTGGLGQGGYAAVVKVRQALLLEGSAQVKNGVGRLE